MDIKKIQEKFTSDKIQLHIAEYNALTARCSNLLNIQPVLLATLITWLSVMIGFANNFPNWFFWIIVGGGQVFGIISAIYIYSYFRIFYYIETILKPMIEKEIGQYEFWKYHSFITENKIKGLVSWELSGVLLSGLSILVLGIRDFTCTWNYFIGLGTNIILLLMYLYRLKNALKYGPLSKRFLNSFKIYVPIRNVAWIIFDEPQT